MSDWYAGIEKGIRQQVWLLRNNGINTTCSCEHEMYIEFDSYSPTEEKDIIYNTLTENGYEGFIIEFCYDFRSNLSLSTGVIRFSQN